MAALHDFQLLWADQRQHVQQESCKEQLGKQTSPGKLGWLQDQRGTSSSPEFLGCGICCNSPESWY